MARIALLLPGFIRNTANFDSVIRFMELNAKYDFHVFCNTYDVIGLETKEPSDRKIYLNTDRTDRDLIEDKLHPKALRIVGYLDIWDKIDRYFDQHRFDVQRSAPGYWEKQSRISGSKEDEVFILKRIYAQWNMVYQCWALLEQSDGRYDCVVRSRYDYDITGIDLSSYVENIKQKTLYGTKRSLLAKLDNGVSMHVDNDCVCFGDFESMRTYCQLGEDATFYRVASDVNFDSKDFFNERGKSIRLSSESMISYWSRVCNDLGFHTLRAEHASGLRVMRKHKHYASYLMDPDSGARC